MVVVVSQLKMKNLRGMCGIYVTTDWLKFSTVQSLAHSSTASMTLDVPIELGSHTLTQPDLTVTPF